MKYFSIFTGVGGFEEGIKRAISNQRRFDNEEKSKKANGDTAEGNVFPSFGGSALCVGFSEIDRFASQVLRYHYPNIRNYGDATKINPDDLPEFDLLCGGFPCQSFSIAGKRMGFEDTRGTLFFEIARILKVKRPRLVFLENVKGLLSHDNGRTFLTILSTLDELGYNCEWQVLNGKNFGVPQNRERVFIIGHLRGTPSQQVFPVGESCEKIADESSGTTEQQDAQTQRARDYANQDGNFITQINHPPHSNDRVYSDEGISPSLNTMQGGRTQPKIMAVLTPDRPTKRQNGRRFKEDGEPSFSLTGQDIHGISNGTRIRKLTPIECERLQSFPDDWTKYGINDTGGKIEISDSQRYKMMGNAVTVNVIEAIAEKLQPSRKGGLK